MGKEDDMGLIDDLRLDIGDDEEFFEEACTPQIWCATIVTDKVYDKARDDTIIFVNPTLGGPTIINLNSSSVIGQICVIKDMKGDANINPILIRPPSGGSIDGFAEIQITQRLQSFMFTCNGSNWSVI